MLSWVECIDDYTRVLLVGPEEPKKRRFLFFGGRDDGPRMYRKDFNHAEFVGEELCNIRNLRCAHFFLIGESYYKVNRTVPFCDAYKQGCAIKLGSYDFRDTTLYDYFQIEDKSIRSSHNHLEEVLNLAIDDNNRRDLLDDIEEMFALDTFMGQTDRYWNNIIFQRNKETGEVRLAPLYDFEYSLNPSELDHHMIYGNALHSFRGENDYIDFIEEHPEFAEKLRFYLNVDLMETIHRSYRRNGLRVPPNTIPFFIDFENERKNFISRIVSRAKVKVK